VSVEIAHSERDWAVRSIILTIPKASPSLNSTTRAHWRKYYDQKKLWRQLVWVAKIEAKIYGEPMLEHFRITITRYAGRLLDIDNLVGGVKPLVDSLKDLCLIVDDSPDRMALTVCQECSIDARTVIQIDEKPPNRDAVHTPEPGMDKTAVLPLIA
jgi:hypothetical protein